MKTISKYPQRNKAIPSPLFDQRKEFAFAEGRHFNCEMEEAVLGVLLLEPKTFRQYQHLLRVELFYHTYNIEVFTAICELDGKSYPIDLYLVIHEMMLKGFEKPAWHLTRMTSNVVSSAHFEAWTFKLRECAIAREVAMLKFIPDDSDALEQSKVIRDRIKSLEDVSVVNDWDDSAIMSSRVIKEMEATNKDKIPGLTSPFPKLDDTNGGFREGDLVIIGARPGMGKTALAGNFALHTALQGIPVGIISLEMPSTGIHRRILSAYSGVDYWKIDRNNLYFDERERLYEYNNRLSRLPIHYSDRAKVTVKDIVGKATALIKEKDAKVIAIDYLTLISIEDNSKNNKAQDLADITRELKLLAKDTKTIIFLLSQLNRTAVNEKPSLHHLRDGGGTEQDADVVLMPYRDTAKNDTDATLFIAKWRNGKADFTIDLTFHGTRMQFTQREDSFIKPKPAYNDFKSKQANDVPF